MAADFYYFGEILWDCLPSGRHGGGAPCNVTVRTAQLCGSVSLISAIGQNALRDEILAVAKDKGVDVEFVRRVRPGLATGTVIVTVDENGNATFELVQPAAWDEITVTDEAVSAVARSRAFAYGSRGGRSLYTLEQLDRLLGVQGPLKFLDRQIFVHPPLIPVS